MMRHRSTYAVAAALVAMMALAGCKKDEPAPEAATPPPSPTLEPSTPTAPAVMTASVTGVELGTAVGADMNVTTPSTTFAPSDTIIAAVSTATSDPAATVNGTLGAKWTFGDTVVHEESKEIAFNGKGVTNFQISKPDGWPAGSYTLEVTLDGATVQTRDFEVK